MKAAKKVKLAVQPIPEGHHTITPGLMVRGAGKAIDFYKKVFGAEEIYRMHGPDGKSILHAELRIGDSRIYLGDEFPSMGGRAPESLGGTPVSINLYVENVDAVFERAVKEGATVRMPVADMFWGDRYGKIADPFGHEWGISTHKEDLTPVEIRRGAEEFFRKQAGGE